MKRIFCLASQLRQAGRSLMGFSLIETLIVVGASTIIGTLLITLFLHNNSLFHDQSVKTSQNLSANDAYAQISDAIRQASAIAASYNAPPLYTTNSSTLVLQLPAINSSGAVIANIYDHIVIARDTQRPDHLREMIFPNAQSARATLNQIIAKDVSSIQFYYLDSNQTPVSPTNADSINFTVNLSTAVANSPQQSSVSGQINLRNN